MSRELVERANAMEWERSSYSDLWNWMTEARAELTRLDRLSGGGEAPHTRLLEKLLQFALRCSSGNPASLGSAVNDAQSLLIAFGIEPRERGVFWHTDAADLQDARSRLATLSQPIARANVEREWTRAEATPVDDEINCAFISGWNARIEHGDDFDMALHHFMKAGITNIGTIALNSTEGQDNA